MFGPTHRLFRLLKLFVFSLGVYSAVRLFFLVWNWAELHKEGAAKLLLSFYFGLRFDLSALAFLFAPLLLLSFVPWPKPAEKAWHHAVLGLYLVINLPFLIFNLVDVEFVNFVGRRMSADVLFLLKEVEGKAGGFIGQYYGLMIPGLLLAGFMVWGAVRLLSPSALAGNLRWHRGNPHWLRHYALHLVLCVALLALTVLAGRGGLQSKPLAFVDANRFSSAALNAMTSNTSFSVIKTLSEKKLERVRYFADEGQMLAEMNGGVSAPSLLDGQRAGKPQNVVLILMESFGLEYMGEVNGVPGYTPFLDQLSKKSLFFRNGFANGRRSIEGVASAIGGIPSLMDDPFVSSPFANNRFSSLGTVLAEQHYHNSFFHGGNNGTMYFDSFTKGTGIPHYFGANEFPDQADHDGAWGIYDEPFFQFFRQKLGSFEPPFFATIFSLSSHQPYRVPKKYQDALPHGKHEILHAIAYADLALRRFFEQAEKETWFKDTLFVITADHAFQPYLPQFENEPSRYRVPIIFYQAGRQWPSAIDRAQVVQQIDILPSVLDLLGLPQKQRNYLARSVFVPGRRSVTEYINGKYYLFAGDYYLSWPKDGPATMYRFGDFSGQQPLDQPAERKAALTRQLQASIQYFSEAMLDNRIERP